MRTQSSDQSALRVDAAHLGSTFAVVWSSESMGPQLMMLGPDGTPAATLPTALSARTASATIASDGNQFLLVWNQPASGGLLAQHVRADGTLVEAQPLAVSLSNPADITDVQLAFDGVNYRLLFERDTLPVTSTSGPTIESLRISPNGVALEPERVLALAKTYPETQRIACRASTCLAVWCGDTGLGNVETEAMRLDSNGAPLDSAPITLPPAADCDVSALDTGWYAVLSTVGGASGYSIGPDGSASSTAGGPSSSVTNAGVASSDGAVVAVGYGSSRLLGSTWIGTGPRTEIDFGNVALSSRGFAVRVGAADGGAFLVLYDNYVTGAGGPYYTIMARALTVDVPATASDAGAGGDADSPHVGVDAGASDGNDSSSASPIASRSGCGCRAVAIHDDRVGAVLGIGALALIGWRRRSRRT
jgi:hypothetical protein